MEAVISSIFGVIIAIMVVFYTHRKDFKKECEGIALFYLFLKIFLTGLVTFTFVFYIFIVVLD